MKSLFLWTVVGLLILAGTCTTVRGQGCATTLQPEFSAYTSVARNGENIYTTVTMQGYANVSSGPGCNMSVATHKAGAQNVLGSTGGWQYSASGCPTCYYSITNNQQIVGIPGDSYTWDWTGEAICSIVGVFWGSTGGGTLPGCVAPATETTTVEGAAYTTETSFNQSIGDSAKDNFDGQTVEEGNAAPGQDTC